MKCFIELSERLIKLIIISWEVERKLHSFPGLSLTVRPRSSIWQGWFCALAQPFTVRLCNHFQLQTLKLVLKHYCRWSDSWRNTFPLFGRVWRRGIVSPYFCWPFAGFPKWKVNLLSPQKVNLLFYHFILHCNWFFEIFHNTDNKWLYFRACNDFIVRLMSFCIYISNRLSLIIICNKFP